PAAQRLQPVPLQLLHLLPLRQRLVSAPVPGHPGHLRHRRSPSMRPAMDKFLAEFFGTLILVLFGCGAAVLGGVDHIGQTGFVLVILGATHARAPAGFGGLAIGLTLAAIHLVGIQVTGVSVNPARSLGPAVLAGGHALEQLWLFIVAPLAGGVLGAGVWRLLD